MAGHINALCAGLCARSFHITVACPSPFAGLPATVLSRPLPVADRLSPYHDVVVIRQLRGLLRSGGYDLMHAHGLKAALLASLAVRGVRCCPLVITLHNALPPAGYLTDAILRWSFAPASRVVVVSPAQAETLAARRLIPGKRVAMIPNGISLAQIDDPSWPGRHEVRAALRLPENDCLVFSAGRLITAKGFHYLLHAAALLPRYPRVWFAVAGAGPERANLEALAATLGLAGSVLFLGQRGDVPALLRAADVFVLPSLSEGMPLSILEAMAARLPVVATEVGGVSRLVVEGETGHLVPPQQPAALAAAISRLAGDDALRAAMGAAGRRRVAEHFTEGQMLEKLALLYRDTV